MDGGVAPGREGVALMKIKTPPVTDEVPVLKADYHAELTKMSLSVMVYGHYTTPNPEGGTFWHPEIIMGSDGALIVWRGKCDPHNNYGFDGFVAQLGPHTAFGGTYRTLDGALAWLRRARAIQAERKDKAA